MVSIIVCCIKIEEYEMALSEEELRKSGRGRRGRTRKDGLMVQNYFAYLDSGSEESQLLFDSDGSSSPNSPTEPVFPRDRLQWTRARENSIRPHGYLKPKTGLKYREGNAQVKATFKTTCRLKHLPRHKYTNTKTIYKHSVTTTYVSKKRQINIGKRPFNNHFLKSLLSTIRNVNDSDLTIYRHHCGSLIQKFNRKKDPSDNNTQFENIVAKNQDGLTLEEATDKNVVKVVETKCTTPTDLPMADRINITCSYLSKPFTENPSSTQRSHIFSSKHNLFPTNPSILVFTQPLTSTIFKPTNFEGLKTLSPPVLPKRTFLNEQRVILKEFPKMEFPTAASLPSFNNECPCTKAGSCGLNTHVGLTHGINVTKAFPGPRGKDLRISPTPNGHMNPRDEVLQLDQVGTKNAKSGSNSHLQHEMNTTNTTHYETLANSKLLQVDVKANYIPSTPPPFDGTNYSSEVKSHDSKLPESNLESTSDCTGTKFSPGTRVSPPQILTPKEGTEIPVSKNHRRNYSLIPILKSNRKGENLTVGISNT